MQIKQIYEKYEIMPQLETHMLRVAGVGKLILDGWSGAIDRDLVMRTLLLHDMGNIVKFDLTKLILPIENIEHWIEVQQEWWNKYGRDTHGVTVAIARELKQDDVIEVFEQEHGGYSSGDTGQILRQSWPAKMLAYADVRVTPTGVVPMRERIADLQKRYGRELSWYDFLYPLEEQIREQTTLDLNKINEQGVTPFFTELLGYNIET